MSGANAGSERLAITRFGSARLLAISFWHPRFTSEGGSGGQVSESQSMFDRERKRAINTEGL
jgi:hypothetical protein